VGAVVGAAVGDAGTAVGVAVAAAPLLTVNVEVIFVVPLLASIAAVIMCWPFASLFVSYGFATVEEPPAKSYGALFSVWRGVPDADVYLPRWGPRQGRAARST
jgi:hypothetical protein